MKVQDLDTENEFLWNKNKFLNRQVHMQQMYQRFEEGGSPEPVDKVIETLCTLIQVNTTQVIVACFT